MELKKFSLILATLAIFVRLGSSLSAYYKVPHSYAEFRRSFSNFARKPVTPVTTPVTPTVHTTEASADHDRQSYADFRRNFSNFARKTESTVNFPVTVTDTTVSPVNIDRYQYTRPIMTRYTGSKQDQVENIVKISRDSSYFLTP